jgi:hydrogenase expression/formation protein HypC
MCLAVPARIIDRSDMTATVEVSGVTRRVSLVLLPDARVGEYVLVHAGFAIQTVDEEEANKTLELFEEMAAHENAG